MWMLLLGCSAFEELSPPEPVVGPIPSLERHDGVLEAVPTVRPMAAPEALSEGTDKELLDDLLGMHAPPTLEDVRAQVLADPSDPILHELVARWTPKLHLPGPRRLLDLLMADESTCEAVLAADDGTNGAAAYDGCPWFLRDRILASYPEASRRDAWTLTPLPDDLAPAFLDGRWLPSAVVRNYPDEGARVGRALARCADDAPLGQAASCVLALSDVDWADARDRRSRLLDGPTKAVLERFATGTDLEAWLDAQGFPTAPSGQSPEAGSLATRLRRRGALWEPMQAPARIALLLRQLGIDDAVTRVLPPTAEGRYTTVHVFAGGQRYRVLLDPVYGGDAPQAIGLANRIARDVGASRRALWFEDPAHGWVGVVGPPSALEALTEAGFVYVPEEPWREPLSTADEAVDTASPLDLGL